MFGLDSSKLEIRRTFVTTDLRPIATPPNKCKHKLTRALCGLGGLEYMSAVRAISLGPGRLNPFFQVCYRMWLRSATLME